jgi:hypothetical protein
MPRNLDKPNTDALRLKVHIRSICNEVHVFGMYTFLDRIKRLSYIWAESDSILTFCTLLNCCPAYFSICGSPNADVCEALLLPARKVLKETNYCFPNKFKINIRYIRPFDIQPMSCFEMFSSSDILNFKQLISRHTE